MRTLNKRQKKLIDMWFDNNWTGAGSLCSSDDMPLELMERLEKISNHETIYQNIDRYINDKALAKMYN